MQRNTYNGAGRIELDISESDNFHHNSSPELELPDRMTPELAEFLGYYMGDGYVQDDVAVKVVVDSNAEELERYISELGEQIFGVEPTVEDKETRRLLCFGGKHLPRYFHDNGWSKKKGDTGEGSANAFIPDEVLRSNEEIAKAFLRGLFEADGTASKKVELSTVSEKLADQVQTLLLSLNVVFAKDSLDMTDGEDHFGDRRRFTLSGVNKLEDKRFLDEIGFITKSTDIEVTNQSHKNDTYPRCIVEDVENLDGFESVEHRLKHTLRQIPINGGVSRRLISEIEEATEENLYIDGRRLTDFYAATVESVTEDKAYTKDISVPSNNTYIADGFVTHNTTSMVGNTTGGCEPIYNVAYYKNVSDDVQGDEMLVEFDDYFLRVLEANDIDIDEVKDEAKEQMANNEFNGVESLESVPDRIGELFVTTSDISAKQHAAVQCACQEGVDSAISKTCNFPHDATKQDMDEVYRYLYRNGGKGVTVYRDGTRSKQVLTTRADNKASMDGDPEEVVRELVEEGEVDPEEVFDDVVIGAGEFEPRARPATVEGVTQKINTGYGGLYVTINEDEEGLFEVFAQIGKSGGYTTSFTEGIARLISLCLRSGIPPARVIEQLEGIRSPKTTFDRGEQIHSVPDAIAKAMKRYRRGEIETPSQSQLPVENKDADEDEDVEERDESDIRRLISEGRNPECPECDSMLVYTVGCVKCNECGYSEC